MTHPLPTANVKEVIETLIDDMIEEEAKTEAGDIRVAYLQRAIEILTSYELLEFDLKND